MKPNWYLSAETLAKTSELRSQSRNRSLQRLDFSSQRESLGETLAGILEGGPAPAQTSAAAVRTSTIS